MKRFYEAVAGTKAARLKQGKQLRFRKLAMRCLGLYSNQRGNRLELEKAFPGINLSAQFPKNAELLKAVIAKFGWAPSTSIDDALLQLEAYFLAGYLPKRAGPRVVAKQPSVSQEQIDKFYDSWDWKRLSYDVKKERGRRCECCGATPEKGARIVTDHIKPLRFYWKLRLDAKNLQVLCDDCNKGKGSRDQTDWRA